MFRYLFLTLLFLSFIAKAQRPIIDTGTFHIWTSVDKPLISNNGKYVSYRINNQPIGGNTTVLQTIDGNLKKEFINIDAPQFSSNSDFFIYSKEGKRSFILRIEDEVTDSIEGSKSIQSFKNKKGDWFVYYINKTLIVQNCKSEEKRIYNNALNYTLSVDGNWLAIITSSKDSSKLNNIELIDLITFKKTLVWTGRNPERILFDKNNNQIAFLFDSPVLGINGKSIGYYKWGMKNAISFEQVDSLLSKTGGSINGYENWMFSEDGTQLFFLLMQRKVSAEERKGIKVDIWSYMDPSLQSAQLKRLNVKNGYLHVINLYSRKIVRLTNASERSVDMSFNKDLGGVLLVDSTLGDVNEAYWNPRFKKIIYLVFARTGKRIELVRNKNGFLCQQVKLSPEGNYVIYYDPSDKNYYSYNIKSGIYKNITKGINVSWLPYTALSDVEKNKAPIGIAGWVEGEHALLINSVYDIWKIDPDAGSKPINLTGAGKRNTVYCLGFRLKEKEYIKKKGVLIKSFNIDTKECGFYSLDFRNDVNFEKLSDGPFSFQMKGMAPYDNLGESVDYVRAKNAKAYLVCKQNVKNSPNFFFTSDFATFKEISDIYPEKSYNWISSELHLVRLPNGKFSQGILYKPDNFDSKKRYPVLFYFYQLLSQELNEYKPAQANGGTNFSIPYFVSNGYLVYTPDIVFDSKLGESALICVESAAKYLIKQPWIDSTKMGISGHSLGGYEADFIATHSKMFAAVVSGAGVSDMISAHGAVWGSSGESNISMVEVSGYRMKVTPWDNLQAYIDASPITSVDKVTAPILIMHNVGDVSVEFSQSLRFYNALRRLGKKVWLVQYDGENHINIAPVAKLDITIRMKQFFDHYLKGSAMPKWMKLGVNADLKGIDSGLGLTE